MTRDIKIMTQITPESRSKLVRWAENTAKKRFKRGNGKPFTSQKRVFFPADQESGARPPSRKIKVRFHRPPEEEGGVTAVICDTGERVYPPTTRRGRA